MLPIYLSGYRRIIALKMARTSLDNFIMNDNVFFDPSPNKYIFERNLTPHPATPDYLNLLNESGSLHKLRLKIRIKAFDEINQCSNSGISVGFILV